MLVQPPTPTWRPCAPAQISACATGAIATGTTAIAIDVNSAAASFFISHFLLLPARPHYRARAAPGRVFEHCRDQLANCGCATDLYLERLPDAVLLDVG